jgi:ABC-type multidrug transport system fused ATPase/permease subunit
MTNSASRPRLRDELQRLWRQLSLRRRYQLLGVAGLILASSLAEMLSLGAVVPFLSVLAEPQQIWRSTAVQWLAHWLGWQQTSDLVWPFCLAFAAAALLAAIVRLTALQGSIRLAQAIGSDLSIEVYRRTLYQPYAVHLQRNSSETISAIANQVGAVVGMLNAMLQLATAGLVSAGLAAVLLMLNPVISMALAAVVGGGYAAVVTFTKRHLQRLGEAILIDDAQLIRSLQEGLGAIRDVILEGSQPTYCNGYTQADRRLRLHRGESQFLSQSPRYAMEAVGMIAIALAALVLAGGQQGVLGALPMLGALALGAQRLLPILQLIYASWNSFRLNQPALTSVLGYLEQPIAAEDLAPPPPPLSWKETLELRDVGFRYGPQHPWILRGVNLTIRRGERLGIVGETGSGKSTLVDLLMGLLQPVEGTLLVDGEPIRGERLRRWRSCVAHVPQSIYLADSSIAENIAFGLPSDQVDQQRLQHAAAQAQIAGYVESLSDGYATRVGERGVQLSGGQRQRIGIARALYRGGLLLVFDEATSALDNGTEATLMASIKSLSRDSAIVMIAHRTTTLSDCDRIFCVQDKHLVFKESISETL